MVKKDREIIKKMWAIYKKNTENYLLSHKHVYIFLLVPTASTFGRNSFVQCSDIAQSKS